MPVVVVESNHAGIIHCIIDTERPGAVITRGRVIFDSLIEFVRVTVRIFEFRNPLGTGTIEDEFDLVPIGRGRVLSFSTRT